MKLLLLSLSTGSGHVRAAEAIRKTAQKDYPNIDVKHVDIFDYISLPFKKATVDGYDLIIKQAPEVWRFLYKRSNDEDLLYKLNKFTKRLKKLNAKKLYKYIIEYNPDYIVSTHLLASDLVMSGQDEFSKQIPLATLVTDYRWHELWFVEGTNHYFVPTEEMKVELLDRGLHPKCITVSGIPVDPNFYNYSKSNSNKIPNILVMSGGQGLGKIFKIVRKLFEIDYSVSIVVITGNNKKLEESIRSLLPPSHIKLDVHGWTDNIDEYMKKADLIISKPGGLTTTECMVLGKPLIVVDPIPGQEEANARYVVKNNAGLIPSDEKNLLDCVKKILNYPDDFKGVTFGKPAGSIILETIKNEMG